MERIKAIIAEKILDPALDRLSKRQSIFERMQFLQDIRKYREWSPEEEKEVLMLRDELYR